VHVRVDQTRDRDASASIYQQCVIGIDFGGYLCDFVVRYKNIGTRQITQGVHGYHCSAANQGAVHEKRFVLNG
jgi:hypothetical protein